MQHVSNAPGTTGLPQHTPQSAVMQSSSLGPLDACGKLRTVSQQLVKNGWPGVYSDGKHDASAFASRSVPQRPQLCAQTSSTRSPTFNADSQWLSWPSTTETYDAQLSSPAALAQACALATSAWNTPSNGGRGAAFRPEAPPACYGAHAAGRPPAGCSWLPIKAYYATAVVTVVDLSISSTTL